MAPFVFSPDGFVAGRAAEILGADHAGSLAKWRSQAWHRQNGRG